MSPRVTNLSRKVGKIDEMLGYAGGLFAIIIAFFAFFLMSFNEYKYELKIAENMFNLDEDGNKVKESEMNIFMYCLYSIYDWVDALFCIEMNWEKCKKIHHTRKEVNKQLDVTRLFRKIQNIEVTTSYLMTEE